jgi:hypothetical protein
MKFFSKKKYIPFQLNNGTWGVLHKPSGELVAHANGLTQKYPEQWARQKAKQLNEGEKQCKDS